eukprot:4177432-Lingulodinium_polyedra.AAC.1
MKDFICKASTAVNFNTANGTARGSEVVDLFVKESGTHVEPYILKSTLDVLSIGLRCMEYEYIFVWPKGQRPYFILPSGQVVMLEVCHNILYLQPGNPLCRPRKRVAKMPLL